MRIDFHTMIQVMSLLHIDDCIIESPLMVGIVNADPKIKVCALWTYAYAELEKGNHIAIGTMAQASGSTCVQAHTDFFRIHA